MNRAKAFALGSVAAVALAGYGGEEAFQGLSGEGLLRAVREECRPSAYVNEPYKWVRTHDITPDGRFLLLLEGETADEIDNVSMLQVLPAQWWHYDSQLHSLPARDLQNLMVGTHAFAQAKDVYPPFRVDDQAGCFGLAEVGTVRFGEQATGAWQPAAGMKGDVARIAMYMIAVYPAAIWDPWCSLLYTGGGFSPQALPLMIQWSREDPVDEREMRRARAVADAQGCAMSPFVRWPGFEDYLWGEKAGQAFTIDSTTEAKLPLRSSYKIEDERIWLTSTYVHPDATWRVDGLEAKESVSVSSLGVGTHFVEFIEPDGSVGSVIITITE